MSLTTRSTVPTLPIVLLILFFAATPLLGQSSNDDWEVLILPYGLFANIEGEAAVGRTDPTSIDVNFGDILENLQIGAIPDPVG